MNTTPDTGQLSVAVIGCGFIGAKHIDAILRSPHAALTAAFDPEPGRAEAALRGSGAHAYPCLDALMRSETLDVVTVATPDHLHVEPVIRALEAGCHVFCEKPLAMTVEDATRMADAARSNNRWLAVDYNRRFGFGYSRAHEWVIEGRIGSVAHAALRVTDRKQPFEGSRGPYALLTTLLSHHIDLLRWFCGEVNSVHAHCARPDEFGQYRETTLSLGFEGGASGVIVGGWREGQSRTDEWAEIGGTNGDIQIDDVQRSVRLHGLDPDRIEELRPDPFWSDRTVFYSSLTAHVLDFLDRIYRNAEPAVTAADGVRGLQIIQQAIESHRANSVLSV